MNKNIYDDWFELDFICADLIYITYDLIFYCNNIKFSTYSWLDLVPKALNAHGYNCSVPCEYCIYLKECWREFLADYYDYI